MGEKRGSVRVRGLVVDEHRCLQVDPKILQKSLKPDGFLRGLTHVLRFRD